MGLKQTIWKQKSENSKNTPSRIYFSYNHVSQENESILRKFISDKTKIGGNTVNKLGVIVTIIKLFQNVKETQNLTFGL